MLFRKYLFHFNFKFNFFDVFKYHQYLVDVTRVVLRASGACMNMTINFLCFAPHCVYLAYLCMHPSVREPHNILKCIRYFHRIDSFDAFWDREECFTFLGQSPRARVE